MKQKVYLIFENETNLFKMENILIENNIFYKIKSTPRRIYNTCIKSIIIYFEDLEKIEEILCAYSEKIIKKIIK